MNEKAFTEWLDSHSIRHSHLAIREFATGRGLEATEGLPKGSQLFHIPEHLFLTTLRLPPSLSQPFQTCGVTGDTALAVLLLWERAQGPASQWAPWIQVLPREYSQPIFFSPSEREELQGSNVAGITAILDTQIADDYQTLVLPLTQKFPELFPLDHFSEDLFRWALATLWSRAFDLSIRGETVRALVPFADLFNHHPGVMETHKYSQRSQGLECHTDTAYRAGDEVFLNYGAFPNHRLLRLYGFVLPHNPHDSLQLWTPMSPHAPLWEAKRRLLVLLGSPPEDQPFELRPSLLPPLLLPTLRVQRLLPEELSMASKAFSDPEGVSPGNERMVIEDLLGALQAMLAQYPTTLEEDQELLNKHKRGNLNKYHALVLRCAEKEILRSIILLLLQKKQRLK